MMLKKKRYTRSTSASIFTKITALLERFLKQGELLDGPKTPFKSPSKGAELDALHFFSFHVRTLLRVYEKPIVWVPVYLDVCFEHTNYNT